MLQPALLGGVFIGVLSALPLIQLGNCCCLWLLGGGMLAAYLDQQNDPRPITVARGATAGVLAGLVGAVIWTVVGAVVDVAVAPIQQQVLGTLRDSGDLPPEVRDVLDQMSSGGTGGPFRYIFGFLFALIVCAIFPTIGGMLGALFFKKDVPPALGGPIQPPPLP